MKKGSITSFIVSMMTVFLCALILLPASSRCEEAEQTTQSKLVSFVERLDFSKEKEALRRIKRAYIPSVTITDVEGKDGSFTITGNGLLTFPRAKSVRVALWTAEDQSDLYWYDAPMSADGSCRVSGNVSNHKNHFGKYHVHMYVVGYDGTKQNAATNNVTVKGDNYIYSFAADKGGTKERIRIAYPNLEGNPASDLKVGVWSNMGDKDDLKWYPMKEASADLYEVTVSSGSHKHGGVYNAHIYSGDRFIGKLQFKMNKPVSNAPAKMIALTFDDGPGKDTGKILAQLKKYKAHATFFVVGPNARRYTSTLKAITDAGCEIGNHTNNHSKIGDADAEKIAEELDPVNEIVKEATGKDIAVMRPPYGDIGDSLRQNSSLPMILWSIDSLDWKTRDAETTIKTIMENAEDGDIVLMHDIHAESVDAAVKLIPMLKEEGFELVTVSELAAAKGEILSSGIGYGSFK